MKKKYINYNIYSMSNPNTSFNKTSNRSDDIDKEVAHLLKKSDRIKSSYAILEDLKGKYKEDEIIDSIMKRYNEKLRRVRKLAEKIKDRLLLKYPNLTMKEYIEKITDYKKKYDFDDSEMQAIINYLFLKKDSYSNPEALDSNYNEMSKALGFLPSSMNLSGKLNLKKDDFEYVQNLLTLAGVTKELHNQVILQHFIYEPNDLTLDTINFQKEKINIFSYVHPVIVALFYHKIDILENHMLLAGIADIIQHKQNGQDIMTQPEYELYWDIATDPAETACVSRTKPFADLVNRANIQTKLWEAVLNMRQGKFYLQDHLTSFIVAIDACRASVFDAADLAFVKDEGTIMRKLLAAFSLRPTIVLTTPVYGVTNITSHIPPISASHITTLSMITIRIPTSNKNGEAINLEKATNMNQLYIHHRQLTIKEQSILHSREILIFYVHRRTQTINHAKLTNPYAVSYLPMTMNQFENINQTAVMINELNIGTTITQKFELISAIVIDTKKIELNNQCNKKHNLDIIISCNAYIKIYDSKDEIVNYGYKYKPLELINKEIRPFEKVSRDDFIGSIQCKGTLLIFKEQK